MSRKYFILLGLFLVAGFLFLNTNSALAVDRYWTGAASTSTIGGKDFWNPSNWDTAVPADGDDVWIFATSTLPLQATVVISTPVDLGVGKIYLGYNQKGNTLANSSAPLTLLIREGASLTNRNLFEVGTSSTVLLTSGSLSVGTTTMKQYASTTISSVTGATSTVTIKGDWTFLGGATYTSPSNSTTTITGTTQANTITSTSTTALTFGYLVFSGAGGGTTNLEASTTVANRLNISAGRTLNAEGAVIALTGSNSNSMTFPFEVTGTFTAATSTVTYSGTAATTVASTTYSKVNWNGAATYSLNGATTVTNAGTVASGATLALLANTLTATGSTWTNSGTVSRTTGKIVLASSSRFDDGTGTAKSAFDGDARNRVGIQVTDTSLNYDAAVADTQTATITAKSIISDVETITLTESTVSSGIFRGSVIMGLSGSNVGAQLDFQGPGTLSYTFTDSQDSGDTGTGGAGTFTGTAPGGGGGGSTVAVTATPAVPATPATPAVPAETPAVPATPATPATPAAPSLDSVSTKIASVVLKVAALTKDSPAADIATVQAEILAILNDIQAIQAASPAPAGVALGFKFVRPLALGLRHADVSNLQKALKTDSSVYPEGTVSGYFGPLTLKAVQKFQEKYGIASSGVTGYGNVGPKTREKLNALYGGQ